MPATARPSTNKIPVQPSGNMKINLPLAGETKAQFMTRSVRLLMKSGKSKENAIGIAERVWNTTAQQVAINGNIANKNVTFSGGSPNARATGPGNVNIRSQVAPFAQLSAKLDQAHNNTSGSNTKFLQDLNKMFSQHLNTMTAIMRNNSGGFSGGNPRNNPVVQNLSGISNVLIESQRIQSNILTSINQLGQISGQMLQELSTIRSAGLDVRRVSPASRRPKISDYWTRKTQAPRLGGSTGNFIEQFMGYMGDELPILNKIVGAARIISNPVQSARRFLNTKIRSGISKFRKMTGDLKERYDGNPEQLMKDAGLQVMDSDQLHARVTTKIIPDKLGELVDADKEKIQLLRNIYDVNAESLAVLGKKKHEYKGGPIEKSVFDLDTGQYYSKSDFDALNRMRKNKVAQFWKKQEDLQQQDGIGRLIFGLNRRFDKISRGIGDGKFEDLRDFSSVLKRLDERLNSDNREALDFHYENKLEKLDEEKNKRESYGALTFGLGGLGSANLTGKLKTHNTLTVEKAIEQRLEWQRKEGIQDPKVGISYKDPETGEIKTRYISSVDELRDSERYVYGRKRGPDGKPQKTTKSRLVNYDNLDNIVTFAAPFHQNALSTSSDPNANNVIRPSMNPLDLIGATKKEIGSYWNIIKSALAGKDMQGKSYGIRDIFGDATNILKGTGFDHSISQETNITLTDKEEKLKQKELELRQKLIDKQNEEYWFKERSKSDSGSNDPYADLKQIVINSEKEPLYTVDLNLRELLKHKINALPGSSDSIDWSKISLHHSGGEIKGKPGEEVYIKAKAGEYILTATEYNNLKNGISPSSITNVGDELEKEKAEREQTKRDEVQEELRDAVKKLTDKLESFEGFSKKSGDDKKESKGFSLFDMLKGLGTLLFTTIPFLFKKIWKVFKGMGSLIKGGWNLLKGIGSHVVDFAKGGWNLIKGIGSHVADFAKSGWNMLKNIGTRAADFAKNGWEFLKNVGSQATDFVKGALDKVKDVGGKIWDGAKEAGGKLWDGAKNLGGKIWDGAKNLGSKAWEGAKNVGGKIWDGAKNLGSKAWEGVKGLGGKIWDGAKGLWNSASKYGKKAWKMGKKLGKSLAKRLPKWGAKFLGKKIPLGGGAAIGGALAADRAMDGDYFGAALEGASGAAAAVPVFGTAASAGIDVFILGRDVWNDMTSDDDEDMEEGSNDVTLTPDNQIEKHHTGGLVRGIPGKEKYIKVKSGEYVLNANDSNKLQDIMSDTQQMLAENNSANSDVTEFGQKQNVFNRIAKAIENIEENSNYLMEKFYVPLIKLFIDDLDENDGFYKLLYNIRYREDGSSDGNSGGFWNKISGFFGFNKSSTSPSVGPSPGGGSRDGGRSNQGSRSRRNNNANITPMSFDNYTLGDIMTKHETSGRGLSTISSGVDDPGGVSYGSIQMASKRGTPARFVEFLKNNPEYAQLYNELAPHLGTETNRYGAFANSWTKLANDDQLKGIFKKAETEFRDKEYLTPAANHVRDIAKINPELQKMFDTNPAVREMLLATSIQHGPTGLRNILNSAGASNITNPEDLIKAVQNERIRQHPKTAKRYGEETQDYLQLSQRFTNGELIKSNDGSYRAKSMMTGPGSELATMPGLPDASSGIGAATSGSLYAYTQDAMNRGVTYNFGAKNSHELSYKKKTGQMVNGIDCSGWVSENTLQMMRNAKDENGHRLYSDDAIRSMIKGSAGGAAGLIQNLENQFGENTTLTNEQLLNGNLTDGMIIGMDTGQHGWDKGRHKGIDHVVQAVKGPDGKMYISESSSSRGVHMTEASEWLKKNQKHKLFGQDITRLANNSQATETGIAGLQQNIQQNIQQQTAETGIAALHKNIEETNAEIQQKQTELQNQEQQINQKMARKGDQLTYESASNNVPRSVNPQPVLDIGNGGYSKQMFADSSRSLEQANSANHIDSGTMNIIERLFNIAPQALQQSATNLAIGNSPFGIYHR